MEISSSIVVYLRFSFSFFNLNCRIQGNAFANEMLVAGDSLFEAVILQNFERKAVCETQVAQPSLLAAVDCGGMDLFIHEFDPAKWQHHVEKIIECPPAIVLQPSGNNLLLSWSISAQGFTPQSTTNLADNNSWTSLTNLPVIVDSQNRVTDTISGGAKFYRLKK